MPSSIKDEALDLARRGWRVFPCKARDKIPATPNGFKDSTREPAEIERLFARTDLNLGIATGPDSGVWVLDLDGPEGLEALAMLEHKFGTLPETVSARTGGGGRHLYFTLNGESIRNRSKIAGEPIDCRGDGGYVVAPPSKHKGGASYEWINSPESTELAEAPEWLVDLVLDRSEGLSSFARNQSPLEFTIGGDLDLRSDAGASKGERHHRALKLIGSELGKGTDPVEVAQLATEWNRRCSPPLADEEILKIVSDLTRKHGTKIEATTDEIDRLELPEPPAWPTIDSAAYCGLAGELVQEIEPESEADPVGLLAQVLVSFGNLVGRDPHYLIEGTSHHTNLFTVLVGATSKGRKGTSEGRVRSVFREVDREWSQDRIMTGLVSGEGLVWNVRDPIYKTESIKEKGRIVGYEEVLADTGIEDKRLLVVEPEFASVLRVCRRETNTLSPTLRSAWDTGELRTMGKQSPARSTGAHVSIVGHITKEELERSLPEVEGFSGFSNRFIWLLVRRSKLLPEGGRDLDLSRYERELRTSAEYARTFTRMKRDDSATRLWRDIYLELSQGSSGLVGAVTSRGEAQVLRLSMIYALLDQSSMISLEHLQAALALWRYAERSAEIIFGASTGNSLADQVLELIRTSPGLSRRELHRSLGNHVKAKALVQALAELRDQGLARPELDRKTGGRPAERWHPRDNKLRTNEQSLSDRPGEIREQSEQSEQRPIPGDQSGLSSLVRNQSEPESGLSSLVRKSSGDEWEEIII